MKNLKPLTAKKTEEKKKNTLGMLITLFIAIMFLGSTIGYVFYSNNQDNTETQTYNDFRFIKTDYGWQTNTNFGTIVTTYTPEETKEIECDCAFLNYQVLQTNKIYVIALTNEEKTAAIELLRNFQFNRIQRACLPENANKEECTNLPLKSCENASESKIIIFKEKKIASKENMSKLIEGKASFNSGCLVIEGRNLIKASDRVIFKIFGIQ